MGRDALENILWNIFTLGESSGERYANGGNPKDGKKEIEEAMKKILDITRR